MFSYYSSEDLDPIQHVGILDISQKSDSSLEWNGLSISNCPEAWKQICGCHGDTWTLVPQTNVRFLDRYALDDDDMIEIRRWAVDAGYFEYERQYKVSWYDYEYEEIRYFLFGEDEEQEARDEYEFKLEEECDGIDFEVIEGMIRPTNRLLSISLVKVDTSMADDIAIMLYAEEELGYDGVWFEERYDPYALSAPRGVIFNSCIDNFEAIIN